MTHIDEGNYKGKHPPGTKVDSRIVKAVKDKAREGLIGCRAAHATAQSEKVAPSDVGTAIDLLEIRIAQCQLGLFGYGEKKRIVVPAASVSKELAEAITLSLDNGRLTCARSWEIADTFGMTKMELCGACEYLGIKIARCQLGAFQ